MRTTNNSIINRPSRLCLAACLPHSHPAKARQTTPNHSTKSFVRNKATCQNDSRAELQNATPCYNFFIRIPVSPVVKFNSSLPPAFLGKKL